MRFLAIPAIAALAFASCSKEAVTRDDEPATATPKTKAKATTPAPAKPAEVSTTQPPVATPAPAPTAPQLAPEGVFYLIAAARVETPDGVRGLPPGTGVKLVRPGVYLTPAGEVPLAAEQLTNDLAVARAARDAAAATQAALQQRTAAEAAAAAAKARTSANENAAINQAALKEIDRDKLVKRIEGLRQQISATQTQMSALYTKSNNENYNKVMKGRVVTSTTQQQITQAQSQLAALRQQLATAETELYNFK